MINQEQLSNRISEFIEKSLFGNTPFASTSDFISYIARKKQKRAEKIRINS